MRKLLLYGFIFFSIGEYFPIDVCYQKSGFEGENHEKYKAKMKDSIAKIVAEKEEGDYFSLGHNDNAINYYDGMDVNQLMPQIKEQLMEYNNNPKGNSLISYEGMVLNKVRFLNHRWIIADFTGEAGWGEIIIKYFVEKDGKVTFEPAETLLYPQQ